MRGLFFGKLQSNDLSKVENEFNTGSLQLLQNEISIVQNCVNQLVQRKTVYIVCRCTDVVMNISGNIALKKLY